MNVETLINFGVQLVSHDANVEARHTEVTQIVNDRMCCLRELNYEAGCNTAQRETSVLHLP